MPLEDCLQFSNIKLKFLSNKIAWFGKYSGYECLPGYLPGHIQYEIIRARKNKIEKVLGKIFQIKYGWYNVRPEEIFSELRFYKKIDEKSISHILYLENHIHLFNKHLKSSKLMGTIHLPLREWKTENLRLLSRLENAIILYKEDFEGFSEYMDANKLHVIKHGVDTDFFRPAGIKKQFKNKILFVGFYLRNLEMFYKVYLQIYKNISPAIEYHFIIPEVFRNHEFLQKLKYKQNIFFHQNLSDEELLAHYQTSYLLLMPMNNSGANTAIIQALSTGLPILTTDVGGIRSYGGFDIFPLVKQNDVSGMVELFSKYYQSEKFHNDISLKQREFAIKFLKWETIVNEHINLYSKIISAPNFEKPSFILKANTI